MQSVDSLSTLIQRTLTGRRSTLRRTVEASAEVVIFGSSAAGLRAPSSDLDILCLSDRTSHFKDARLDLLCLSPEDARSRKWVQSELASHIACYGVWMAGRAEWVELARVNENVARAKRARLESYATALSRRWDRLNEPFRQKYAIKLRRETQRLILLGRGTAVPPTATLDRAWDSDPLTYDETSSALFRILRNIGGRGLSELEYRVRTSKGLYPTSGPQCGSPRAQAQLART